MSKNSVNNTRSEVGKLSFAITRTSKGQELVCSFNEEVGNIKKIAEATDDRNFYKKLDYKEATESVIYCISHANDGCYFRILRYISGRVGDNIEAWIFVPSNLIVSSEQLNIVVGKVQEAVCASRLDELMTSLDEIFNREYKVRKVFPVVKESSSDRIAYREIPEEGISALLGDNLFQSYYYDYKKVLFLDTKTFLVKDYAYDNISNEPLTSWITIKKKPDQEDISVYVDDMELRSEMMIEQKGKYTVRYVKEYLNDIEKNISLSDGISLPDGPLNFTYTLRKENFEVYDKDEEDEKTSLLEESTITINGKKLKDVMLVSVSDLKAGKLEVLVSCEGYEELKQTLQFEIPINEPLIFNLIHKRYNIGFVITHRNLGYSSDQDLNDVSFELSMKNKEPEKSPLFGYYVCGKDKKDFYHLRPKWYVQLNKMTVSLIALFSIVLLIAGAIIRGYMDEYLFEENAEQSTDPIPDDYQKIERDSVAFVKIIKDKILTDTISLQDMEEIGYEDFYDDLNSYNFVNLRGKWTSMLLYNSVCGEQWNQFLSNVDTAVNSKYKPIYSSNGEIQMNNYIEEIKSQSNR